jgi:hypothetical protein
MGGGRSGSPYDGVCTDCHDDGTLNGGPGALLIQNTGTTYAPGQQIDFSVTITENLNNKWGFQVSVRDGSGNHVGALTVTDATNTLYPEGDTDYVGHSGAGNAQNTWNLRWTAPGADVGNVTIYAAGIASNNGQGNRGDSPYASNVTLTPANLPVELASFEAITDGDGVILTWATASEVANVGFDVEHAIGDDRFETTGFVAGTGGPDHPAEYRYAIAGLQPGRHRFRLRQLDLDGTFTLSQSIEVAIETPGSYEISELFPNPFNPRSTLSLAVSARQHVSVFVVDALGRRVADLYSSTVPADETIDVAFDAASLPSGLYLIRVVGEDFATSRKAVLLK